MLKPCPCFPAQPLLFIFIVSKHLNKFIGDKPIKNITKQDIDGFIVKLKEKYKQNRMVNRTAGLRHYMKYLGKDKEIDIKVVKVIHTKTEADVLTEDELQRLFQATQDNKISNAILKTLYYTGIRESELINLNIEDIDFESKQVIIRNGKGMSGSPEIINIHDQALESIKRYLEVRETPKPEYEKALFVSSFKRRICPSSIEYIIQDARAKVKITKWIYPHMFRSSLITHMHQNGASAFHIQQQSRHKSLDVLKGYIRPGKEQRLKTYESFVSTISNTEVK